MMKKIYPRTGDTQTVYLNTVIKDPYSCNAFNHTTLYQTALSLLTKKM